MNTLRREDLEARFPKLLDAVLSSKPPAEKRRKFTDKIATVP